MIVCYNKKGKLEGLFFNNGVLCDGGMTVTNASTGELLEVFTFEDARAKKKQLGFTHTLNDL